MKFLPRDEATLVQTILHRIFCSDASTLILHYLYYFLHDRSNESNCINYRWKQIKDKHKKLSFGSRFNYPYLQELYEFVNVGYTELDHSFGDGLLETASYPFLTLGLYYRYRDEPNLPFVTSINNMNNSDIVWGEDNWGEQIAFHCTKKWLWTKKNFMQHGCIPYPLTEFPTFSLDNISLHFPANTTLHFPGWQASIQIVNEYRQIVWRWVAHCRSLCAFGHDRLLNTLDDILQKTKDFEAVRAWCIYWHSEQNPSLD